MHTCQLPEYKNLETFRKLCICENVIKDNVLEKPPKITQKAFQETGRFNEKLGELAGMLMAPEICTKMLKKMSEKLGAKFPATPHSCSMVKISHLDDS